ncbi:major facilitator superfamily domain-containing protein [Hypoxylon sp. FL1150]|nr:major facilitator superfamily domain-containing protein [Hypoxylon sp. FL1150]
MAVNEFDIRRVSDEPAPERGPEHKARNATNLASTEDQLVDETEKASSNRQITGIRWVLVCTSILCANFTYGLDTTIAADIQAAVSDTYHDTSKIGWLGVGFALGSVAVTAPIGKCYGIFNTKWLYISCLAMFAAASGLCGAAPTMNAMIVGRVWAGASGAGMYIGTLNLFTRLTTSKEQPFYMGLIGFMNGVGEILGPIIGGSFADSSATWRWGFYFNLIIFAVMSPIYLFCLPSLPNQPEKTVYEKIKRLDFLGTVLSIGFFVSLTVAFSFGGTLWAWGDARIIALFVVCGILMIAFVLTQYYSILTNEIDRLIPCHFLGDMQLLLLNMFSFLAMPALFMSIYYIPLYFLFVDGSSGIEAAIRLLPFIMLYIFGLLSCGALARHVGWYQIWFLVSGVLMTASGAAMYAILYKLTMPPISYIYGVSVVLGISFNTSLTPYALAPRIVREASQVPFVIQLLGFTQNLG